MLNRRHVVALATVCGALSWESSSSAQSAKLVPFTQFYQQVANTTLSAQAATPGSQVASSAAFETMRSHVLGLYAGVTVKHSFLLDAHPFDCVPVLQQPGARQIGLTALPTPPQVPTAPGTAVTADAFAQLDASEKVDPLGNTTLCESGTIPMRRVGLDDIARFASLQEFFQKGPDGAGQLPPLVASPAVAATHKYAHSTQSVANLGGSSLNNLWTPTVNTGLNEVFSLSQFWYANTTKVVETIEMGFQNYPQHYNVSKSVLFIYWTSDAYNKTGCYNLECTGFVQTNKNVYLGKGFNNYSTAGGSQYAPQLSAYLSGGNWWLYLNGGAAANAIGYYPGSLYKNTPMAKGASSIDYGGEVVGTTIWPPMGSGAFANKGFGQAAFDRNILYFPATGGAAVASLTAQQPSPSCFTDVVTNAKSNSGSGTYFYFGGPGGKGC